MLCEGVSRWQAPPHPKFSISSIGHPPQLDWVYTEARWYPPSAYAVVVFCSTLNSKVSAMGPLGAGESEILLVN